MKKPNNEKLIESGLTGANETPEEKEARTRLMQYFETYIPPSEPMVCYKCLEDMPDGTGYTITEGEHEGETMCDDCYNNRLME